MFSVRNWERFQFTIEYEAHQVYFLHFCRNVWTLNIVEIVWCCAQIKHKTVLERTLPDSLKLSIARKIENNLFSKVACEYQQIISVFREFQTSSQADLVCYLQIIFLVGLKAIGEIRTLFAAEVCCAVSWIRNINRICCMSTHHSAASNMLQSIVLFKKETWCTILEICTEF